LLRDERAAESCARISARGRLRRIDARMTPSWRRCNALTGSVRRSNIREAGPRLSHNRIHCFRTAETASTAVRLSRARWLRRSTQRVIKW